MDIGDHVRLAVKSAYDGELEAALLHALQAVDGTGKRIRPGATTRSRIVDTIEDYLWVIEPMAGLGFNLEAPLPLIELASRESRFSEVIYELFRTRLAHGDPFPEGVGIEFSFSSTHRVLALGVGNKITIPDTVLWALVSAVVFARVNAGQRIGMKASFWYATLSGVNDRSFEIDEWWGREEEVRDFFAEMRARMIRITPVEAAPPQ
jgi:hypothetical protein